MTLARGHRPPNSLQDSDALTLHFLSNETHNHAQTTGFQPCVLSQRPAGARPIKESSPCAFTPHRPLSFPSTYSACSCTLRPVASLVDEEGRAVDFVENELWVPTDDEDALQDLLTQWDGVVVVESCPCVPQHPIQPPLTTC